MSRNKNNLIRLTSPKRCGVCGKKIQEGALVQPIHTREREPEVVCVACLMKYKGLKNEEALYKVDVTTATDTKLNRKKDRDRI